MNTSSNLKLSASEFKQKYHPDLIADYVDKSLARMYTGSAPTLWQVYRDFGKLEYDIWITQMVQSIFKFAGISGKFDATAMPKIATMIKSQFGYLKATEFMHFVYLMWQGEYQSFYGNPNGQALLNMLKQYVNTDRATLIAKYKPSANEQHMEAFKQMDEATRQQVATRIQAFLNNEAMRERERQWRDEPHGTALVYAYTEGLLTTYPGDMTEAERQAWAKANPSYVERHPNLRYKKTTKD